jgi:hypothetical protein
MVMKKFASVVLVVMVVLLAVAGASEARGGGGGGGHHGGFSGHRGFHHGGHGRVFIGVAPSFYWGPYGDPYWWYYPPYPYWSYYPPYEPAPVVLQEPPVYIQQPGAQGYWYYCATSRAYYPTVQTCAEPWVPVPPRTN